MTQQSSTSKIDGVICFGGEDWWYHNRGHFDMQMMKRLARRVPVLYVNSIGMRVPRPTEGKMFLRRVIRKLKSIRRGLVTVEKNMSVMSAFSAPGKLIRSLSSIIMPWQVSRAARSLCMKNPLIWVACPPAAGVRDKIKNAGVVYQRTDRFEAFPHVDSKAIRAFDVQLKTNSVLTIFCSRLLLEAEGEDCQRSLFVDHGVDFEQFRKSDEDRCEPGDVMQIARPRIGFIGGIDSHTFDPPLFRKVVEAIPEFQFILVGACSLPDGWCDFPNVHFVGQKDYQQVAHYMAACDVLIMPWNDGEWIEACNPVKLKEYLAVGRPVVSTWFRELERFEGHVRIAKTAEEFAQQIRQAIENPGPEEPRWQRVSEETWDSKANEVLSVLQTEGIEFVNLSETSN